MNTESTHAESQGSTLVTFESARAELLQSLQTVRTTVNNALADSGRRKEKESARRALNAINTELDVIETRVADMSAALAEKERALRDVQLQRDYLTRQNEVLWDLMGLPEEPPDD